MFLLFVVCLNFRLGQISHTFVLDALEYLIFHLKVMLHRFEGEKQRNKIIV